MEKMPRRKWLATAGVTTVAAGATGLVAADDPPPNHPRVFQNIPPRELLRQRHFPNVELINQDGKKVHFYDDLLKDRKVVINFMFTKCDKACPIITHNLVRVQNILADRIGHDIFMYSISLSPEEDTPKVLKQYMKARGIGPGWTFYTGKPEDILLLRRSLGFLYNNPKEDADSPCRRWSASRVDRQRHPQRGGFSIQRRGEWPTPRRPNRPPEITRSRKPGNPNHFWQGPMRFCEGFERSQESSGAS